MKFGLTNDQFNYLKNILSILIDEGAKIWCFGSRATGRYYPYSDIDLLVESNSKNIKIIISKVNEILEESNFPYKVDIVLESEIAESYKFQVNKEKVFFL